MTSFKSLHLNEKIQQSLENKGYTTPTPIQAQAIPHILAGRNILGIAQTGTGKTAAFSLPLLDNLAKSGISVKTGCIRALILTPTRELASQIAENIEAYGKDLGLRYAVIFGGVNEKPQIASVKNGVDILIATPGRLLDLTSQGHIRYMQVEVLILDEADRMLDMGFIGDIRKIVQKLPEKRQTLFFSATMPDAITSLADSILKDPVRIEVTPPSTTVDRIAQKVLFVEKSNKPALLKTILKGEDATSVLVFSKTKHGANKVVEHLEKHSIKSEAIHGNKSQSAREKALAAFRAGEIKVLVATDIAARGIDIKEISHVINYDIPVDPESYVHRIGRTARAGREGIAISFCDPSEVKYLREVEKSIKIKIPVDESHPYHGVEGNPSNDLSETRERRPRPASRSNSRSENRGNFDRSERTPRSSAPRRDNHNKKEEGGILGFFGLGKKTSNSKPKREFAPRSRDDRRSFGESIFGRDRGEKTYTPRTRSPNSSEEKGSREERRFNPNRREGGNSFGFGERNFNSDRGERSSNTRRRENGNSFGERKFTPRGERSERSFGGERNFNSSEGFERRFKPRRENGNSSFGERKFTARDDVRGDARDGASNFDRKPRQRFGNRQSENRFSEPKKESSGFGWFRSRNSDEDRGDRRPASGFGGRLDDRSSGNRRNFNSDLKPRSGNSSERTGFFGNKNKTPRSGGSFFGGKPKKQ